MRITIYRWTDLFFRDVMELMVRTSAESFDVASLRGFAENASKEVARMTKLYEGIEGIRPAKCGESQMPNFWGISNLQFIYPNGGVREGEAPPIKWEARGGGGSGWLLLLCVSRRVRERSLFNDGRARGVAARPSVNRMTWWFHRQECSHSGCAALYVANMRGALRSGREKDRAVGGHRKTSFSPWELPPRNGRHSLYDVIILLPLPLEVVPRRAIAEFSHLGTRTVGECCCPIAAKEMDMVDT